MKQPVLQALLVSVLAMAGGGTGCSPSTARREVREENHPLMRRGVAYMRDNEFDRAIPAFEDALARRPRLARAHLELGMLYDRHREDYLRAIYHYERYLDLRPHAEKRPYVEQMIQFARFSFAASLPDRPSEAVRQIAQLREENRILRAQIEEALRGGAGAPAVVATGPPAARVPAERTPSAAPPAPAPTPPAAPERKTVEVRRGDTLSSIAARLYGDSTQWRRIYEANRDQLSRPGDIRPGQILTVPPTAERRSTP